MNLDAEVVAAHGRQYRVALADGTTLLAFPRGKKSEVACGDRVVLNRSGDGQAVIDSIAPRTSLLYRSDEYRKKLIAANVTQIVFVVAVEPGFSAELLTRCLVAAEEQELRVLIVLNKCDLAERVPTALATLAPFVRLGYPLLQLSALACAEALRPHLAGQLSVLVGQSGMGKSTLINALIPEAKVATREISAALDSGKHTTTHATLYRFDAASALIDSPGLQEFGLHHLPVGSIEHAFVDFRPFLGDCRFRDCRHEREPDCAIRAAVERGDIDARRYEVFRSLRAQAGQT
ncbi:ribosome small subunit-dependent GTPase A [Rhodocyclus tenuis]|nr:ribosome small subunit-dependent GTPase A [Rhodocyclus tenuis]